MVFRKAEVAGEISPTMKYEVCFLIILLCINFVTPEESIPVDDIQHLVKKVMSVFQYRVLSLIDFNKAIQL